MTVQWRGPSVVLRIAGEIDMTTAGRLEEAVALALTNEPRRLVLDLSDVAFFSSAGISTLVATREATCGRTGFAVVTGDAVFRSLKLTGLDVDLTIYSSVDDALAPG
ncbi:MAG: STAS domain-containing protein [Thermocrispum sp.]